MVSSKLLRDQDGTTRGVGFVSFAVQEDATRAINDMDGRKVRCRAVVPPRHAVPACEQQPALSDGRALIRCILCEWGSQALAALS